MPCTFKGYDPNFAKTSALSLQTSVLTRNSESPTPPAEDEPAEDSPGQGAMWRTKQPAQVPMDSPEYDAMMREKLQQAFSSPARSPQTPRPSGSGSSKPTR